MKIVIFFTAFAVFIGGIFFFSKRSLSPTTENIQNFNKMSEIILESSAFKDGEFIPEKYACGGENINPPLEIKNPPEGAKSFVLIMDDPDATGGVTWVHWLLWNVAPEAENIKENFLPENAVQGTTSFGKVKYGGPCPPRGSKPHRYMFKLYALDAELNLQSGATKPEIEKAMQNHIITETVLIGLYQRK